MVKVVEKVVVVKVVEKVVVVKVVEEVVVVKVVVVKVVVEEVVVVKDTIVPGGQGVIIGTDLSIIQHNMYQLLRMGVDAGTVY